VLVDERLDLAIRLEVLDGCIRRALGHLPEIFAETLFEPASDVALDDISSHFAGEPLGFPFDGAAHFQVQKLRAGRPTALPRSTTPVPGVVPTVMTPVVAVLRALVSERSALSIVSTFCHGAEASA
jgi:hypothetical protein